MAGLLQAAPACATQTDIHGPAGSGAFGTAVVVLPNGNIVVTDPVANDNTGAVYVYTPSGALVSTLTGSNVLDQVGSGGITILKNGNFVVSSPGWANGAANAAGAVTWVSADTGLSGVVSAANSLVGSTSRDIVGATVTALSNGNYVVATPFWTNGAAKPGVGAVTWANGSTGLSGVVSAANSLIGSSSGDRVGLTGVTALRNGNYVVPSPYWANGTIQYAGAVTWANGSTGLSGEVSVANSLVGTQYGDEVGGSPYAYSLTGAPLINYGGGVTALSDGNYVVATPTWANNSAKVAGAVTWANGSTGLVGVVSVANSLVGMQLLDEIGGSVTELNNGNYVIGSPLWSNGAIAHVGAVTLAHGGSGLSGAVATANSLFGTTQNDLVGFDGVTALSNGNYVVGSSNWTNGTAIYAGAATWVNGDTGLIGAISAANSLVGTTAHDDVALFGVTALSNGNYVVESPFWDNGAIVDAGAATWANGTSGLVGAVSAENSLVGTTASDFIGDMIGTSGVTALSNGNYVVASAQWNNGAATRTGAVTWANGSTGLSGPVSLNNSLVGTSPDDLVGWRGVTALSNGNYVVASHVWGDGVEHSRFGAATWANGSQGLTGVVSAANSLVGTTSNDDVGGGGVTALGNGNYVVSSPTWANGAIGAAGAVTLGRGSGGLVGAISAVDSVRGTAANGGAGMVFAYDAARDQLVVGQPASNTVSLLVLTPPSITIDGYMSGNWYDDQQAGHGFQIEAATNNIMIAIWFVYAPDGSGQNWIYAQGTYDKTSSMATLPAIMLTGAKFPPNFASSDLTQTAWGNLTFSFSDCNHGTATWSSPLPGYGVGSLPITRLTQIAGTTCP